MAKQVAIFNEKDFSAIPLTPAAKEAYKFAYENAGLELEKGSGEESDFITKRNVKTGWRDLWELKAFFEKAALSIKEVVKHTFNVGEWDDLPLENGVKISWSKQSYTYEYMQENCGVDIMQKLQEKGLCSVEQVLNLVPVNVFAKAAGINQDKMFELFPEYICAKAKERTLSIK
jgi:hypothetical protein